ncbi:DUF2141 domain-containing protein [Hyunsoonleella pacifica]|uniref:DUF2141 domain-containing protein n=1 Tax=Hyunsoonleella pacifica TaxID=1080224 RepID=A0A4V2JAK9_9FLAO|nr:DUF2141 domain-containing protein [Hyunsoonleella pacifica]TBN13036.1 DUF2141 domain-containing protein [Hyunsoonleella pacifica]GGD27697.1 hypothetical protein GCM10011368_32120 [Hyunsoonleella pacifica]
MKTLSTLFIALFLSINLSNAQETTGKTITVTINNITNNNGHVLLSLHTENTFMKGPGIMNAKSEIIDGKITVTFKNVIPGTYAIMTLHDENDNNAMDFDDSGMPKESYGMSNNPMSYGPPQYASAKFNMTKDDLEMKIRF